MGLSKFIANYDGIHFVAGVNLIHLQESVMNMKHLKHHADSFLGLSRAFVSLTSEELFSMGGFAVALQPKQVLEIPAGYLIAQTALSAGNIIVHWVGARADKNQLGYGHILDFASVVVQNDLDSASLSELDKAFLKRLSDQISVGKVLLPWAVERLKHERKGRLFRQKELAQHDGVQSLDKLREMFNEDSAFHAAAANLVQGGFAQKTVAAAVVMYTTLSHLLSYGCAVMCFVSFALLRYFINP